MACYHPNRAAYVYGTTINGKKKVKLFPKATSNDKYIYENRSKHGVFYFSSYDFETPYWNKLDTFLVPCGQCVGCRLDYSRRWATRLMLELQCHQSAFFVTLTYDDDNLPFGDKGNMTLVPDDVTKFMKRLRKEQSQRTDLKIRFYLAGEYGDKSNRPHYHLILFDWIPPEYDLQFLKYSRYGDEYYYSLSLQKLWKYGNNLVANVTWKSCAYVARYIMKKQNGANEHFYDDYGIEKEFTRMSREPGIGKEYYDLHKEDMLSDGYVQLENGMVAPIPRYFDPYFEIDFPEEYQKLSENRIEIAKMMQELKEFSTEIDYFEQLIVDENSKKAKAKMLVRPDI